jgi:DNA-binding protein YbaB
MDEYLLTTITSLLARAPTDDEVERVLSIEEEYKEKVKKDYEEYENGRWTGSAIADMIRITVDKLFHITNIEWDDDLDKELLQEGIKVAMEEAIKASSKAYKDYLDRYNLRSAQMASKIVSELGIGKEENGPLSTVGKDLN